MNKPIPLLVPDLPAFPSLVPYLKRIDAARWYTNFGPLVVEFERALEAFFQQHHGVQPQIVTASSGALALEVALLSLNLKPGSFVLVPAFTFIGTATAVVRAGLTPIFADVCPDAWLLTPKTAREAALMYEIAAVLPVAALGCPVDPEAWDAFAEETKIPVVIDAAGAIGNQRPAQKAITVFSTHATKPLASGEGGFIADFDVERASLARQLTNFGIHPAFEKKIDIAGTNAKMSEYHAAVGLAALAEWEASSKRRSKLHEYYVELLSDIAVTFQDRPRRGVYSVFAVLTADGIHGEKACMELELKGVQTRQWYCPLLSEQPVFYKNVKLGTLLNSLSISQRLIGLPFHTSMTKQDVIRVSKILMNALR